VTRSSSSDPCYNIPDLWELEEQERVTLPRSTLHKASIKYNCIKILGGSHLSELAWVITITSGWPRARKVHLSIFSW